MIKEDAPFSQNSRNSPLSKFMQNSENIHRKNNSVALHTLCIVIDYVRTRDSTFPFNQIHP